MQRTMKNSLGDRIIQTLVVTNASFIVLAPGMMAFAADDLFGTVGNFVATTYNTGVGYALILCALAAAAAGLLWALAPSDKAAQAGKSWVGRIMIGFVIILLAPLIVKFIQDNVGVHNLTATGIEAAGEVAGG